MSRVGDEELAARLASFFDEALGGAGHEVHGLRRLSGGASRETFALDLTGPDGHDPVRPLILQRVRPGAISASFSMVGEARLLEAAAAGGVPVAGVVAASDDAAVAGASFVVVERLEGETIPRRILRGDEWAVARRRFVAESAAALAAIHRIDPAAAPSLRAQDPLGQLVSLLDGLGQPHPAFELGLRWLADHRPPAGRTAVVHGDYRFGNVLVGPDGVVAVLDWELAHLGDPLEDLGWFCVRAWRFGGEAPVAGLGSYDELFAAYEAAGGGPVDPAVVRWWEVLGTLRWGVICILQAHTHLSGASRSVELAAIGRRVCETEYDLLRLLGREHPGDLAERLVGDTHRPGPHGAPSAPQLVEAVREYLERDVLEATEGRTRFHGRVAVNVLGMVERELRAGPALADAHGRRLAGLGVADDAELAAAIRAGTLDDRADEVADAVWASVLDALAVANPGYA